MVYFITAGCTLNAQYTSDGMTVRAADAGTVYLACYAQPFGATITAAGLKTIVAIRPDGSVTPHTVFTSGATQIRSVATVDGRCVLVR